MLSDYCQRSCVRALLGLVPPDWGDAVVGTAAAIAAEAAAGAAARLLLHRLPPAVRGQLLRQLDSSVAVVFKEGMADLGGGAHGGDE